MNNKTKQKCLKLIDKLNKENLCKTHQKFVNSCERYINNKIQNKPVLKDSKSTCNIECKTNKNIQNLRKIIGGTPTPTNRELNITEQQETAQQTAQETAQQIVDRAVIQANQRYQSDNTPDYQHQYEQPYEQPQPQQQIKSPYHLSPNMLFPNDTDDPPITTITVEKPNKEKSHFDQNKSRDRLRMNMNDREFNEFQQQMSDRKTILYKIENKIKEINERIIHNRLSPDNRQEFNAIVDRFNSIDNDVNNTNEQFKNEQFIQVDNVLDNFIRNLNNQPQGHPPEMLPPGMAPQEMPQEMQQPGMQQPGMQPQQFPVYIPDIQQVLTEYSTPESCKDKSNIYKLLKSFERDSNDRRCNPKKYFKFRKGNKYNDIRECIIKKIQEFDIFKNYSNKDVMNVRVSDEIHKIVLQQQGKGKNKKYELTEKLEPYVVEELKVQIVDKLSEAQYIYILPKIIEHIAYAKTINNFVNMISQLIENPNLYNPEIQGMYVGAGSINLLKKANSIKKKLTTVLRHIDKDLPKDTDICVRHNAVLKKCRKLVEKEIKNPENFLKHFKDVCTKIEKLNVSTCKCEHKKIINTLHRFCVKIKF